MRHFLNWKVVTSKNRRTENKDVIASKVTSTLKEIITNELSTMVEETLQNTLRAFFLNVQSGIRSVVYNVVEQLVLDLLHQEVIAETLETHIAKFSTQMPQRGFHKGFCR